MSIPVAGRQMGRVLVLSTAKIVSFGPFLPGERIRSITVYLTTPNPITTAGPYVSVEISSFTKPPASAAEFATGRSLVVGPPRIPYGSSGPDAAVAPTQMSLGPAIVLPLNWIATDKDRYLSFQFTDTSGFSAYGSCWIDVGDQIGLGVEPELEDE